MSNLIIALDTGFLALAIILLCRSVVYTRELEAKLARERKLSEEIEAARKWTAELLGREVAKFIDVMLVARGLTRVSADIVDTLGQVAAEKADSANFQIARNAELVYLQRRGFIVKEFESEGSSSVAFERIRLTAKGKEAMRFFHAWANAGKEGAEELGSNFGLE